jgi:hypothetical protein
VASTKRWKGFVRREVVGGFGGRRGVGVGRALGRGGADGRGARGGDGLAGRRGARGGSGGGCGARAADAPGAGGVQEGDGGAALCGAVGGLFEACGEVVEFVELGGELAHLGELGEEVRGECRGGVGMRGVLGHAPNVTRAWRGSSVIRVCARLGAQGAMLVVEVCRCGRGVRAAAGEELCVARDGCATHHCCAEAASSGTRRGDGARFALTRARGRGRIWLRRRCRRICGAGG